MTNLVSTYTQGIRYLNYAAFWVLVFSLSLPINVLMKHLFRIVLLMVFATCGMHAESRMPFAAMGVDTLSASWTRDWYQFDDLRHYLDNFSPYTVPESETTGRWGTPEQLVFSISGNSFRWNRYYLRGFHVDNRLEAGSTLYDLSPFRNTIAVDYHRGTIAFAPDSMPGRGYLSYTGNVGGIGGVSPGTQALINLFHKSALQRAPEDNQLEATRQHIGYASRIDVGATIDYQGRPLAQHIFFDWGTRWQPMLSFPDGRIGGIQPTPYYLLNLDGELPMGNAPLRMFYMAAYKERKDTFSEFWYTSNEQARSTAVSASVYFSNDGVGHSFPGTLTFGLTGQKRSLNFSDPQQRVRHLDDLDGEAFEPWYPLGQTYELSQSLTYDYAFFPWLSLRLDTYNSLFCSRPQGVVGEPTRWQVQFMPTQQVTHFTSSPFVSGLLENAFSLQADRQVLPWLRLQGMLGLTLDGLVVSPNTVVTPSWEASLKAHFHPAHWFDASISLGNYRARYSYDDICFLSPDYLGTDIRIGEHLRAPQYMVLDIPVRFTFRSRHGVHTIESLNQLRKYYNLWTTRFVGSPEDYGFYQDDIYFLTDEHPAYQVCRATREDYVGMVGEPAKPSPYDSPLYLSDLIRYSYEGTHVFFSLSWQSYQMSGISALGNGPISNSPGVLSLSTANPNTHRCLTDPTPQAAIGRMDADRAYICRIQLGTQWSFPRVPGTWQAAVNGHFKDGTPITNYQLYTTVGEPTACHEPVEWAIVPVDTKGINPANGHFGKREDAFFNIDLRLAYNVQISHRRNGVLSDHSRLQASLTCYNIYDFATELGEVCFDDGLSTRTPLLLTIPRGLLFSLSFNL